MVGIAIILLIPLLFTLIIPRLSSLFAPNTENDGRKRSDPYTISDGSYMRSYHPCLEDGDAVWFEYIAEGGGGGYGDKVAVESGSYSNMKRFYITDIESDYEIRVYKGRSKDRLTSSVNDEVVFEIDAGAKYYIEVKITSGDVDAYWTMNIGRPIPEGATADKAYNLYEGENASKTYASLASSSYEYNSAVWFTFTPEESGKYTFKFLELDTNCYVHVYDDPDSSYLYYNNFSSYAEKKLECALEANTTYYVKVSAYSSYSDMDSNFAVNVTPEPKGMSYATAYEVTLGENYAPSAGYESLDNESSYVWFKFTPTVSGKYIINTDGTSGTDIYNNCLYTYNDYGQQDNYYYEQNSTYYELTADTTYYFRCESDYGYDFNLSIELPEGTGFDNALELSLDNTDGTTVEYIYSIHNHNVYLQFTPSESGFYEFTLSGFSSDSYLYLYEEENTSSYLTFASGYKLVAELDADTTYYVRVYSYLYNDTTCYAYVNEAIGGADRTSAIQLNFGGNEVQDWEAVEMNSAVYFKFTPDTSDYYCFTLSDGSDTMPYYVYDSVSGSSTVSSTMFNGEECYYLSSAYTYYLYYSVSSDYGAFGVNVLSPKYGSDDTDAIELTEGVSMATGYSNYNYNGEMWFKFVPETTGSYKFTLSNAYNRYLYIFDRNESTIDYTTSDYITVSLTAGETYYAYVRFYSSYDYDFNISVAEIHHGANAADAIVLNSNTAYVGYNSSYNTNGEMWFEFTATNTYAEVYFSNLDYNGYYKAVTIYSDNLTTQIASNSTTSSYMYVYAYNMTPGQTYYVKITFADSSGYSPSSSYADTDFSVAIY